MLYKEEVGATKMTKRGRFCGENACVVLRIVYTSPMLSIHARVTHSHFIQVNEGVISSEERAQSHFHYA